MDDATSTTDDAPQDTPPAETPPARKKGQHSSPKMNGPEYDEANKLLASCHKAYLDKEAQKNSRGHVFDIAKIKVGKRYRSDMGDLAALAEDIRQNGLLHPVVVTPKHELIAGERRLRACRDHLRWTKIDVRVIDTCSILAGEYAENALRKDFTPSERQAIAKALEKELNKRNGTNQHTKKEGVQIFAHPPEENGSALPVEKSSSPPPKGKSRDIAAKAAGFGNAETYRQATKVVEKAAPEIVEAMDDGKVSISDAAKVAELPAEVQQEALTKVESGEAKTLARAVDQTDYFGDKNGAEDATPPKPRSQPKQHRPSAEEKNEKNIVRFEKFLDFASKKLGTDEEIRWFFYRYIFGCRLPELRKNLQKLKHLAGVIASVVSAMEKSIGNHEESRPSKEPAVVQDKPPPGLFD